MLVVAQYRPGNIEYSLASEAVVSFAAVFKDVTQRSQKRLRRRLLRPRLNRFRNRPAYIEANRKSRFIDSSVAKEYSWKLRLVEAQRPVFGAKSEKSLFRRVLNTRPSPHKPFYN